LAEGEPVARAAVSLNAQSAEAWYVLGRLLNRLGKIEEAERALLTATLKESKYPEPHYLLSQLYRKLGRTAEADQQLQLFEDIKKREPPR
jgi:predicted Zn-dependent protease